MMLPTESFSKEEVEDCEKFMRQNTVDGSNMSLMLQKFKITRQQRRQLIEEKSKSDISITPSFVLNKYPLFLNLKDAVNICFKEFEFIYHFY